MEQQEVTKEQLEIEIRHRDLIIEDLKVTIAGDAHTTAHLRAMVKTKDQQLQAMTQKLEEIEKKEVEKQQKK